MDLPYRRSVRNYGKIARPLTDLLKKGKFEWTTVGEDAIQALKKAMTTAPVMVLPDFSQPFQVEYDALGKGI